MPLDCGHDYKGTRSYVKSYCVPLERKACEDLKPKDRNFYAEKTVCVPVQVGTTYIRSRTSPSEFICADGTHTC